MHKAVNSLELSRHRRIKCASAWILAFATLSVAVYGTVLFEPVLASHFDWPILLKLNQYVFPVAFLNRAITAIIEVPILIGAPLVALFWYLWFESNSESAKAKLLLGLGAAIAAVILSRGLQLTLPTHIRPLLDPVPGFNIPPGVALNGLNEWNSVPSDHACVYFALVTVIWRRSHMLGLFGLLPALINSLPRVYLGYHYPSDVVLGALLGISVVMLVENYGPETFARRAVRFEQQRPGIFYFWAFLLSFEVSLLFGDIRQLGVGLAQAYRFVAQ
jgi:undecaprenyl-diphosphatase